jgi:FdhD protein
MNHQSVSQRASDLRRESKVIGKHTVKPGIRLVQSRKHPGPGQPAENVDTQVIQEDALTIDVEDIGTYTLMWTPTDLVEADGYVDGDGQLGEQGSAALALTTGFLFTEGIIRGMEDIHTMAACDQTPGVVRVQLKAPENVITRRRNVMMTSSCGVCGSREVIENNSFGLTRVPDKMRLDARGFSQLMKEMQSHQAIFAETGGAHAAAIFSADGLIHAVAEDLGRHNALDKVIGATLLAGADFSSKGALLSSRLSLEMVTKAVRAGLEIVAAVSAPTSLAIEVAESFGLTLCGFVRGERATIFTHPHRIERMT